MKVLDLKLTYRCNNDCKYCCQERGLRNSKSDLNQDRILTILDNECLEDIDKVVLTGGEPTLNHELGDIVQCLKARGIKAIQLQTNARKLKNYEYLNYLVACGVNSFGISLHGNTASMHEAFTGTADSFNDVIIALQNIRDMKLPVALNCVITKHNIRFFNEISTFVIDNKLATSLQFAFIHITGKASMDTSDYVPISDAARHFRNLVKNENRIPLFTEAIPLCLMYGCEKNVSELFNNGTIIVYDCFTRRVFSYERVHAYKTKFEQCRDCIFFSHCEGVWVEYSDIFGKDEFVPVKTFRSDYKNV